MKHLLPLLLLIVSFTLKAQLKVGETQVGKIGSPFKKGSVSVTPSFGIQVNADTKDESMFFVTGISEGSTGVTVRLVNNAGLTITKTIPITVIKDSTQAGNDIKVKIPYHG